MRTSIVSSLSALAVAMPLQADMAVSPIKVLAHSALYDTDLQQVAFSVTFDRAPDFFTVDQFGRQQDAFQFYLNTIPSMSYPDGPWERIVRGSEIYVNGDLRIREGWPPAPPGEPSGGWGVIVDTVPYVLQGTTVTFTYSFTSADTVTGQFTYDLLATYYGAQSYMVFNIPSQPLPAPASIVPLIAVLLRFRRRTDSSGMLTRPA